MRATTVVGSLARRTWLAALCFACFVVGPAQSAPLLAPAPQGAMVTLETTLVGSDVSNGPPHAGDWFGYSAGFSGNTAVVGAVNNDHSSLFAAGAAYVFVRSGIAWSEQAKLIASDPESLSGFGVSSTIDGDTIAVGAHVKDEPGITNAGAVYVFVRSGSSWSQQAKLLASDFTQQVGFGQAIALAGDTLAVGSPLAPGPIAAGAVYVFVRSGTTWTQQAKLTSNVGRLAESVAIHGDTIVAGAPTHTIFSFSEGVARVFRRNGTTWSEEAQLQAPDPQSNDLFGQACAVWGGWLMVAAPRQGNTGGAVYAFERVGTTWTWRQKLVSPIPEWHTTAYFGGALALRGDRAMVGAHAADIPPFGGVGRAHLYERTGSNWRPIASMTVSDPRSGTNFGKAVGLDGDVLFVTNEHGQGARKAYAFRVSPDVAFCFGDGSLTTPCPCAPPDFVPIPSGAPGAGCANSFDLNGARLSAGGLLNPDSLRFWADIGPAYAAFAFLVKGDARAIDGIANGDGVRCVDGTMIRFGAHYAGTLSAPIGSWTYPNSAQTTAVGAATAQAPAQTAYYQLIHRNAAAGFCSAGTTNWTNAIEVAWP